MSSSLTEIVLPQRPPDMPCTTTVTDGDRLSLFVALEAVEDPRGRRYPLVSILAAAVCAVIGGTGACTFAAVCDWVRFQDRTVWQQLGFTGRVPAAATVWRLLIRIDAEVLSQVLARWLRSRAKPVAAAGHWWRLVIAVDGKVERGARLTDGRQVHLLAAYDTSIGIVLAQVQITAKSNEIPAFTPLLRRVKIVLGSLKGVLLVADALHAQVGHADLLAADSAHLMVTIKANQPTLHDQVKGLPWSKVPIGRRPARPVTAVRRPARSRRSPSRPRAGWASPTPNRPSGSPAPARSRAKPAARRPT